MSAKVFKANWLLVENAAELRKKVEHYASESMTDHYGEGGEVQRNNIRAAWGGLALLAYIDRVGEDTLLTAIQDVIGDLRHLVDALNADSSLAEEWGDEDVEWELIEEAATARYIEEIQGEE